MPSRALEANIAEHRVDVTIDPRYHVIQEVMARFFGLRESLQTFLEEVCHPRKNWRFIVDEARGFSLGYFHELKTHPRGHEAAKLYGEILLEALATAPDPGVRSDAFKNLFLFWEKIIDKSGEEFSRFLPVLHSGFGAAAEMSDDVQAIMARSYYHVTRLGRRYQKTASQDTNFRAMNAFLSRHLRYTYSYWLSQDDPSTWFDGELGEDMAVTLRRFAAPIAHAEIRRHEERRARLVASGAGEDAETLEKLLDLPGYGDLVRSYREIPRKLDGAGSDETTKHRAQLIFLFHTVKIAGLSPVHEESLKEINRITTWLIVHEDSEHTQRLLRDTLGILRQSVATYPGTVLGCVMNMAQGVYQTDDSDLVRSFNDAVVHLGFQRPDFAGVGADWQIQSNAAHIQNIRTWMEIVALKPKWSTKLLSSLVVHLSLSGVLIKDTDLFPRDITGFLNADIRPVYNLVKQLMRLFPAFFNEIGAEGRLREISTRIDEITRRQDRLVHFLRKQSHVESSSEIVPIIEAIFTFWKTRSKKPLEHYLPGDLLAEIPTEGPYIDGVSALVNRIWVDRELKSVTELSSLGEDAVRETLETLSEVSTDDRERVGLAISFYRLLKQKYCIGACDPDDFITRVPGNGLPGTGEIRGALRFRDPLRRLSGILAYLEKLNDVILAPEVFEPREDLYRKRHIAADIPSLYGSYHETKFDALGLSFRLESLTNTFFEDLVASLDLSFITRATLYQIHDYLKLFRRALRIDGVSVREFEHQLELLDKSLKSGAVTYTQYLDIFRGFTQVISNIVGDYFSNIHNENLLQAAETIPGDRLLPKFIHESVDTGERAHQISETFLRDAIAGSLGLQSLDLLLTRIVHTLHRQAEKLPGDRHRLLLTYNPRFVVTSIHRPNGKINDIVHLGNKGVNIVRMWSLGLPVPPGFIITTEVFRCWGLIDGYPPANENFRRQIRRQLRGLEELTGKVFGDPKKPLLVSVRSGSVVSQPGMMDSYLNVGMNETIVNGIAEQTGQAWFAWDSYRRFLQSYGMSYGLPRDLFDGVVQEFKEAYDVPLKKDFSPAQMRAVAMAYRELIVGKGISVEDSSEEQLYIAIDRVLNSWDTEKARAYRTITGISDDWGTSVTVQAMVFGNITEQAGSGVLFTHSPKLSTDLIRPWGDYTIGNQGEDVVAGLVTTYPISNAQGRMENRSVESSLQNRFPEIYGALKDIAEFLVYEKQWSPQDIEFTFEGPGKKSLFILQARDMEMRARQTFPSFELEDARPGVFLGHGIGVSGGAMAGRAVFSLDDVAAWRQTEPATKLILIRGDTVPDDIQEISATDGLLTARGGATSHAAIVANRLGKTCVAGCTDLVCMEQSRRFLMNGEVVAAGDFISIDGGEGSVYLGALRVRNQPGG